MEASRGGVIVASSPALRTADSSRPVTTTTTTTTTTNNNNFYDVNSFYSLANVPADRGPSAAALVKAANRKQSYLFATLPEFLDAGAYANLLRKRIDFRFNSGTATDDPSDPKNWVQHYNDHVLQGVWLERRARHDRKFWPDLKAPLEVPASQYTVGHDLPARCLFPRCRPGSLRCERDYAKNYQTIHGIPHIVKFYHHNGLATAQRHRDLNNVQWTDYADYSGSDRVESRRGVDPRNWGALETKRRRWVKEKLGEFMHSTEYKAQYSPPNDERSADRIDRAIDDGRDLIEIYCTV